MSRDLTAGATEQQKKMLIVLVAVAGWRFVRPAVAGWAASKNAQSKFRRQAAKTRSITNKPVLMVRIDDLSAEAAAYEPDRNIFRYGQRRLPPPPPPPPPLPPPPRPQPTVERQPPPPTVRRPPNIDFELMGIFGPENRRIAVLVDGQEIINALEEDVVKDQFIVNDIGLQSVEFRFVDFPEDETARIEIGER